MKFEEVQQELIAYHFKTVREPISIEVENHFLECQACLRSYFDLKRAMEKPLSDSVPSRACRARIKHEIMRKYRPSLFDKLSSCLLTPIPLYQGVAAFVAITILVSVGVNIRSQVSSRRISESFGRTPGIQMDSSDDNAGSGNIS